MLSAHGQILVYYNSHHIGENDTLHVIAITTIHFLFHQVLITAGIDGINSYGVKVTFLLIHISQWESNR